MRTAYCVFCVEEGEEEGTEELDDGEEGGEGQVEEFDGLQINFHFEGGELGAAEEENHTKGGEVEEEDEEGCGKDGGAEERQGDVRPHAEGGRAEGTGGGFEFRVQAGEGVANDADNDGSVVENVGEEDGG